MGNDRDVDVLEQEPPRSGEERMPAAGITVSNKLGQQHKQAQLAFMVAVVSLLAALFAVVSMGTSNNREQRVVLLGSDGTVVISPLRSLSAASSHFEVISRWCANIVFQRSAEGLVLEDLLDMYFGSTAVKKIKEDYKASMVDMKKRSLKVFPEITQVSEPIASSNSWLVTVEGFLNLSGSFAGQDILETPRFKLTLLFVENSGAYMGGDSPFKVSDIKIEVWTED